MHLIYFEQINDKIIALRNNQVILDSDVAELYGVETRDINKAVKNNPEKFPEGYVMQLTPEEKTGGCVKTGISPSYIFSLDLL